VALLWVPTLGGAPARAPGGCVFEEQVGVGVHNARVSEKYRCWVYSRGHLVQFYPPRTPPVLAQERSINVSRLAQPAVFAAPCLVAARAHAHTRALNARARVLRPRAKAATAETHALSTDRLSNTR